MRTRTLSRGFTLVELLVVIGIIALLISILMPVLGKVRRQAQRTKCMSNVRQLVTAMTIYAGDNKSGWYTDTADYGADSLTALIPKIIKDGKVAVCPGTSNVVDLSKTVSQFVPGVGIVQAPDTSDLRNNAPYAQDDRGGHSYEIFNWFGPATYPDGTVIPGTLADLRQSNPGFRRYLMTTKNVRKASEIFLILDGDEGYAGTRNNWPDPIDNHGADGLNLGFADGHAQWVTPAQMVHAMMLSRHPWPHVASAIAAVPGLQNSGGWDGRWSYNRP
jgi:prepilin-type N-terminal cleavage/methylation domain-containing protein/prepilin-type processing-associated H-X9-DG protein